MRSWVREHIGLTTTVLTAVAVALVFGATLGLIPEGLLPRAPDWVFDAIPHANAVIAVVALAAMARGFRAIRRGDVPRHRRSMLLALGAFAAFLVLYLYNVSIMGPATFPGPAMVRRYVYLPVLTVHIGLAVVAIPLLFYALLVAVTRPVAEIPRSNHARVARPALGLWAVSFLLGLVVYLQLHVVY